MKTATNPQTGERVILVGGEWRPIEKTATGPNGTKAYLAGGEWHTEQTPQPTAAATQEPESPRSFGNLVGAAVEPLLTLGSGAIAGPLSGLAGIGAMATKAAGLTQAEPADVVRSVGEWTYQPRTVGGQNAMRVIGAPMEAMEHGAEYVGGKVAEASGSPAVGAATKTGLLAIPMALGAKFGTKVGPTKLSAEQQLLAEKGVTLTPGMRHPTVGTFERGAESIPLVGDFVRGQRGRTVTQLNEAVARETLAAVKKDLPANLEPQQALAHARHELGAVFDDLAIRSKGTYDITFAGDVAMAKAKAATLPPTQRNQVLKVIKDYVETRFQNGTISGSDAQKMRSNLSQEVADYGRGGTYEIKGSRILDNLLDGVDTMLERSNPGLQSEYAAARLGWARFKIWQRAAASGKEGTFSPSDLVRAIKAKDVTKDKRAYTEGTAGAGMQPLAEAGAKTLPNVYPEAGNPPLGLVTRGILAHGLLAGNLAHFLNPYSALIAGITPSVYNPVTLQLLQQSAMKPRSLALPGAATGSLADILNNER